VRCWTLFNGSLAPQAAGVIHGDFERGFIKAEVCGHSAWGRVRVRLRLRLRLWLRLRRHQGGGERPLRLG
jgi:hypothetical protein